MVSPPSSHFIFATWKQERGDSGGPGVTRSKLGTGDPHPCAAPDPAGAPAPPGEKGKPPRDHFLNLVLPFPGFQVMPCGVGASAPGSTLGAEGCGGDAEDMGQWSKAPITSPQTWFRMFSGKTWPWARAEGQEPATSSSGGANFAPIRWWWMPSAWRNRGGLRLGDTRHRAGRNTTPPRVVFWLSLGCWGPAGSWSERR